MYHCCLLHCSRFLQIHSGSPAFWLEVTTTQLKSRVLTFKAHLHSNFSPKPESVTFKKVKEDSLYVYMALSFLKQRESSDKMILNGACWQNWHGKFSQSWNALILTAPQSPFQLSGSELHQPVHGWLSEAQDTIVTFCCQDRAANFSF